MTNSQNSKQRGPHFYRSPLRSALRLTFSLPRRSLTAPFADAMLELS
jgi:hypothetical protein